MSQCASHSVGPANQLFGLLIQTILAAQCSISPPNLWPEDYGEKFLEKGRFFPMFLNKHFFSLFHYNINSISITDL